MISMSLAAFAQQVRHAVELHSVVDLLVVLDMFTSISDNFATVGLTVPAQLLAFQPQQPQQPQQPAPSYQDPYFSPYVQPDGWQPQPLAFFAPHGSVYGNQQQGIYGMQQQQPPPAPAHTAHAPTVALPPAPAPGQQDMLLALLTRVLDRGDDRRGNGNDRRGNGNRLCPQCKSTKHSHRCGTWAGCSPK